MYPSIRNSFIQPILALALALGMSSVGADATRPNEIGSHNSDRSTTRNARDLVTSGRGIVRFDTFGDEQFWVDQFHLHRAIAGAANGGIGPGLSPVGALGLGLKVDVEALPARLRNDLRHGRVDLGDPAVTLALLRLNAVVGVKGFFDSSGGLQSVGIQFGALGFRLMLMNEEWALI